MTTITGTLLDGSGNPVPRELVSARLVAASVALTGGGQVIREAATRTDAAGAWSLDLTPLSELLEPDGAYYLVWAAGHRWDIDVPDTGSHELATVVVVPGPLPATGATSVALAAHTGAAFGIHTPVIVLGALDPVPVGAPAGSVIVRTA